MFISGQDSFSVGEAIAQIGSFTPTPTSSMTATTPLISVQPSSQDNSSPDSNHLLPLVLAPILALFGIMGLLLLWGYFYRRRKAKRTAPGADLQDYQHTSMLSADVEGSGEPLRGMRSMNIQPASYAYHPHNRGEAEGGPSPLNQSGPWAGHHRNSSTSFDVRTERRDSSGHTWNFTGGDSPVSLLVLDRPGQMMETVLDGQGPTMERQRLIPPEERY
jgi:hypothetical protein